MQVIYQIISAYFEDDRADELTNEPAMTAILEKDTLASQTTLSRFFNRMDTDTLAQFNIIIRELPKIIYSIQKPEFMLFDIVSTLLDTYGKQEGENSIMESELSPKKSGTFFKKHLKKTTFYFQDFKKCTIISLKY